ncbi:MAG: 4-(cytidine 5'-diphospho)-2-C-methyl-D-erythritol kinase [Bacteroidetes bacterium]|nr:4-(cytidine 5'-diphospho)-2-C-methyl-D-erythritol kinase [Bacteroidota bacterium]MBU1116724.1 4-(cytidine 5'-diphospho)-2-C-methyl-D-erythritol kinase [Bacteroidota bacterium]MBU1800255.1 4-(cytidine 5'-diphospho)-2-C-methyl-D-erythritol kinase [Bacteroidota bacterium]
MERIEIKAPAKINVGLNIVSKRADGFHNLETIFYQIHDLFDELIFEKSNKLELILIDKNENLETENIIIKAIKLLEQKTGEKLTPKITLKKNIPIGAGLGGGSSDAASTLKAINELYKLNFSTEELKSFALELGSDVPLFLCNYPTIGKSRGELLEKTELKINYPILLVNPGIHISTKEAFSNIIPKQNLFNYSEINEHEISVWNRKLVNDFEASVFKLYPEIEKIKTKLNENGAMFSLMSGTGSTVYGIFESYEKAKTVAELFPKLYFVFIGNK